MFQDADSAEHNVLVIEETGTIASVRFDSEFGPGSMFEGWRRTLDTHPCFRLNSSPVMQLELGPCNDNPTTVALSYLGAGQAVITDTSTGRGQLLHAEVPGTIAADDTTPDVSSASVFYTSANTGATAITDLDNPKAGQILRICGGSDTNATTIADSGNFNLSAGFTANADDCITLLVVADNDYIELGRVNN